MAKLKWTKLYDLCWPDKMIPEDPLALKSSPGVCYYPGGVVGMGDMLPSTPTLTDKVDMPVPSILGSEDLHWECHQSYWPLLYYLPFPLLRADILIGPAVDVFEAMKATYIVCDDGSPGTKWLQPFLQNRADFQVIPMLRYTPLVKSKLHQVLL